jgi:formate dehydrogenase major subunit
MTSLIELLSKWPLVRQIRERRDGTGVESMSDKTRAMHARIDGAEVARSICPYCGVGCGQLIFHTDGKLVSIEGDPESPISQGNLCPKGAASYQLLTHSRREDENEISRAALERNGRKCRSSAPWTWWPNASGNRASAHSSGRSTDQPSITPLPFVHLGGATLDNEENYLIKKLFTGGLGMVCVSNQARI